MYINMGPVSGAVAGTVILEPGLVFPFFDDRIISYAEGVDRIWYLPEKHPEPVMKATKPWEVFGKYKCAGGFSGKSIVVKDDKLLMFYSIYHMGQENEFREFAYAESKDGYKWTKPDLGDGTNIIVHNTKNKDGKGPAYPYWEMQNVLFDEHSGLWRAMGHCALSKTKAGTFYASSKSPTKWDPKTFKWAYKNQDIHALLGWGATCYVSFPRVHIKRGGETRRAIGVSYSKDFKTWTDPKLTHGPLSWDPKNYEIYNMPVERTGAFYLAFPIGYRATRDGVGPLDTEFAYSNDVMDWNQPLGHMAYIPRGLPGSWDDCYVMTAAPVNFKGKTMFFYWGCNFPHDTGFKEEQVNEGSVGLATLEENRYVSLACPRHYRGVVETQFISCAGAKKLLWDARGSVSAEVIDSFGQKVPKGELPSKFKVHFELSDAELFSFTLTK